MRKLLTIMMIVFAINAKSQDNEFYGSTRKIDQAARGFIVAGGSNLLIHEGLRLTFPDMKPWVRKTIATTASITINSMIYAEERPYSIGGGVLGSFSITLTIPNIWKKKAEKTKLNHYKL